MKITYKDSAGKERSLDYDEDSEHWSGQDLRIVNLLNSSISDFLGSYNYFPTIWHAVKAVADELKGTLDAPEPELPEQTTYPE